MEHDRAEHDGCSPTSEVAKRRYREDVKMECVILSNPTSLNVFFSCVDPKCSIQKMQNYEKSNGLDALSV
jgi:hypothetical protein